MIHRAGRTSSDLRSCSTVAISWEDLTANVPVRPKEEKPKNTKTKLKIAGFKAESSQMGQLKARISTLVENFGGKLTNCYETCALALFLTQDKCERAKHNIQGQDVFGKPIEAEVVNSNFKLEPSRATNNSTKHNYCDMPNLESLFEEEV